jgi:uncharacterized protein
MPSGTPPPEDPRREAFGYTCARCLRCCHHKRIQLNPYEVARLARQVGVSTTVFRAEFTQDGAGTALSQTETGACVFLGPEGCTVHPDRPLVCRLYPLGREVVSTGAESYVHLTPHPQSEGTLSQDGTIARYLEEQGAAAFMRAADAYFHWRCRAIGQLQALKTDPEADASDAEVAIASAFRLLDMDVAIAEYCADHGIAPPDDIEARHLLHMQILDRQLVIAARDGITD